MRVSDIINKRNVIVISIAILIALLLQCCGRNVKGGLIRSLGGYTQQDVKETIDTISIKTDTVFYAGDTIRTIIEVIKEPILVTKWKNQSQSSFKGKLNPENPLIDSVYVYNQPVSDTLIEGNIKTIVNLKTSKIVQQSLDYKPKFPIFINKTITIEKVIEKTLTNPPRNKYGIGITGTNQAEVGGLLVFQTKKNWQYQGGYLLGANKALNNDYKQGTITVSIIKLF